MSRASRKFMTAVLGATCVFAAAGSASARDGTVNAVSEKVQVEVRNGKVLVRLTIDNQSDRTIYVTRSVASDKELTGNWFEVRDSSNGDPLDYVGPLVKRGPMTKVDFVPVKPHTKHRNTMDITNAYAFLQGRHAYQLTYSGSYLADIRHLEKTTPVEPDSVMFAHAKQ